MNEESLYAIAEDASGPTLEEKAQVISGFWRRLFAFVLDNLVLGVVGVGICFAFSKYIMQMGYWGRLIGFGIVLCYFGSLNSCIGRGQSLGKRLLGIRVVGQDGKCIPLARSLIRSSVLFIPYMLNGVMLPASITMQPLAALLLALAVFALGIGIIYLYIFNWKTRQSVHDLVAGSFVVRSGGEGLVSPNKTPRVHYVILGLLVVAVSVYVLVFVPKLASKGPFPELIAVQNELCRLESVSGASVFVGTNYNSQGKAEWVRATVISNRDIVSLGESDLSEQPLIEDVVKVILDKYPDANKKDFISVEVVSLCDIGIARFHKSYGRAESPEEWSTILSDTR